MNLFIFEHYADLQFIKGKLCVQTKQKQDFITINVVPKGHALKIHEITMKYDETAIHIEDISIEINEITIKIDELTINTMK